MSAFGGKADMGNFYSTFGKSGQRALLMVSLAVRYRLSHSIPPKVGRETWRGYCIEVTRHEPRGAHVGIGGARFRGAYDRNRTHSDRL